MSLRFQHFAQRIINEDGALIVAFACQYRVGDVIPDISIPMRRDDGVIEVGRIDGLVLIGTATRLEWLSQTQRFGTGTGDIPEVFRYFYRALAE